MLRKAVMLASLAALMSLGACDIIDKATGNTSGEPITAADLTGKRLLFHNPDPDTDIGEHEWWEYTFDSGKAYGCNDVASYESTGWVISGENTIRVNFGNQYEQYTLTDVSGTLAGNDFGGKFHLTSSVPGNVADGTFSQITASQYCG